MKTKTKKTLIGILAGAVITGGLIGITKCNFHNPIKTIELRVRYWGDYKDIKNEYKNLDSNDLSESEKEYLNELHLKYGEKITPDELIDYSRDSKEVIERYKDTMNRKELDDKDIIIIGRGTGTAAINSQIQGN